jgi:predicted metalloprotease with PDZ domain
MSIKIKSALFFFICLVTTPFFSEAQKSSMSYTVTMENPEWHFFKVHLTCTGVKKETIDFKMPVWTPGYYQRLDYAKNVINFKAVDAGGNELKWEKTSDNTWKVKSRNNDIINLEYEIKTERPFVATSYLDETRGYIVPAGVFFHIDNMINHPVQLKIIPFGKWNRVATGLDSVAGKKFTYTAPDFDILYDSPLLIGNLDELPSFKIKGITHRFIGYKLGDFDHEKFISDLKKIVEASIKIIGNIPYKHYTFIAIGPGAGGIEHLNNTTFSFNGTGFNKRESYIRTLHFLAHEYFHHYNVKRIRPFELGPFDYDNGSRTKSLWFSEGLSVYYEYMVVRRAGISTDEELFNAFRNNIKSFEGKPGRLFQTLEQASFETWSDGPFGRTGDEVNKTISYYDKGPVVGLLLDFKIRGATQNKKSLDDVMRLLYKVYYQKKKRGFTAQEMQQAFESVAGMSLAPEFEYITTTKEIEYTKYLSRAGLLIDTAAIELPGAWLGFTTREKNDSLLIATVDWESPAWNAGIRTKQVINTINGKKASTQLLNETIDRAKEGDKFDIWIFSNNIVIPLHIIFGKKLQKDFKIGPALSPTPLQKQILQSWLKG